MHFIHYNFPSMFPWPIQFPFGVLSNGICRTCALQISPWRENSIYAIFIVGWVVALCSIVKSFIFQIPRAFVNACWTSHYQTLYSLSKKHNTHKQKKNWATWQLYLSAIWLVLDFAMVPKWKIYAVDNIL